MPLLEGLPPRGAMPNGDGRRVLVMVGMPGSGKSTAAKQLAERGWARVNQDEMGTRKVCEARLEDALRAGRSVVVDRCNFDYQQRHVWHVAPLRSALLLLADCVAAGWRWRPSSKWVASTRCALTCPQACARSE